MAKVYQFWSTNRSTLERELSTVYATLERIAGIHDAKPGWNPSTRSIISSSMARGTTRPRHRAPDGLASSSPRSAER
jgi:hypothetical protein